MRLFLVVALLSLTWASYAGESCTGSYDGEVHGGDQEPLTWKSTYKLVKKASDEGDEPAIYQYERTVQNHSNREVTFVYWDGAAFGKRKIGARRTICEAVQIASAKTGPSTANLYFGASSHAYKTTVWAPKDGWGKDVLVASLEGIGALESRINFASATETASVNARRFRGSVVITSGVAQNAGEVTLQYSLENRSGQPLVVELTEPTGNRLLATGHRPFVVMPRSTVTTAVPLEGFSGQLERKACMVRITGTRTPLKLESGAQVFTAIPSGGS